ncbi:FG-GAP repeat domain-containing protein [Marinimicrobium sp. ARAG 43.8]|uniref:FG-GAP repeat domain-containing protein n=1 Tax=Marinimicrobium sp. ARAG 43.8 TaxID=3418719 RepID=UPI003CFA859A
MGNGVRQVIGNAAKIFGLCVIMATVLPAKAQSNTGETRAADGPGGDEVVPAPLATKDIIPLVQQYCGACHDVPAPSLLPKGSWPYVIDSMVELARNRTGQAFIPAEVVPHIKALYYGSSPEALPRLPYIDQPHPVVSFEEFAMDAGSSVPQILNIQSVDLGRGAERSFLVSDGERSELILMEAHRKAGTLQWRETVVAEIAIPIVARVVDFNGNGRLDILVADLGEFPPSGVLEGKVFVLEQDEKGQFEKRLLMHQLGRVSDIQALDVDGDGDLDMAVAVFGGVGVGEVFWVENLGGGDYEKHDLLGLSGALNVTPVDLDGNGRMDFVSLVAQEHETLIAFINEGEGRFRRKDLVRAGHPLFGATSLVVADLNQNGRPDLVFTNGDAFDTQSEPKPYHGVQWLENKGDLQFEAHDIGRFYGAAQVAVGDMDLDGDLDLVVTSWLNHWDDEKRQSMVWFENDGKQNFQPHPVSHGHRALVPIELVDLTGDGRLDIVTGAFRMDILKEFMSMDGNNPVLDMEAMRTDDRAPSPRLLMFENRVSETGAAGTEN